MEMHKNKVTEIHNSEIHPRHQC